MKNRDISRIQNTRRIDELLASETGRIEYLNLLDTQCQASSLIGLLVSSLSLQGEVIECGVFRGVSIRKIGNAVRSHAPDKKIFACDSFGGFPAGNVSRPDAGLFRSVRTLQNKFIHADDVPEHLDRFFQTYGLKGHILKGYFQDTLPALDKERFCFAHVDCDTYNSHLQCLPFLYERMVPGAIMVFDDYNEPKWPGAKRAIDEFLADKPERVELAADRQIPAWFLRKQ